MNCPVCGHTTGATFRPSDTPMCLDCVRVELGFVKRERASVEDIRAFVDCELAADPRGPVVTGIVAAMHARCA